MRKITKTELELWQYHKRPKFADSIQQYYKPSIHAVINSKGEREPEYRRRCANTLHLIKMRSKRTSARFALFGLSNCPADTRRKERTEKWLKRIIDNQ